MARRRRPTHPLARTALRGLTLIELLVALALMAVLTTLSWRVLDGMTRTQQQTQEHADSSQQWQVALAQWQTDLDALQESGVQPALDFNGRVLRLTRRAPTGTTETNNGLHVVAGHCNPTLKRATACAGRAGCRPRCASAKNWNAPGSRPHNGPTAPAAATQRKNASGC